jgi:hypothetical protein
MVHYIPLAKDFSNIDRVLELVRDPDVRAELTENAYRDLIGSGDWSYARLLASLDETLAAAGVNGPPDEAVTATVDAALDKGFRRRQLARRATWAIFWVLARKPIQRVIHFVYPVTSRLRRLLGIRGPDGVA